MEYDKAVINKFAERLYKKARSTVISYTVMGVIIGVAIGIVLIVATKNTSYIYASAIIFGLLGFAYGTEKAFQYRLQAQQALCLVQIETNTRKSN